MHHDRLLKGKGSVFKVKFPRIKVFVQNFGILEAYINSQKQLGAPHLLFTDIERNDTKMKNGFVSILERVTIS